jgi:hypothetical protein
MSRTQSRNAGLREERRIQGEARNVEWRAKSPAEQLKALDQRLGFGIGAKRQREKLERLRIRQLAPPVVLTETEVIADQMKKMVETVDALMSEVDLKEQTRREKLFRKEHQKGKK